MAMRLAVHSLGPRLRLVLAAALFAGSLVALTCFGVLGRTLGPGDEDFSVFYFGGRNWATGVNPYTTGFHVPGQDEIVLFPYPPNSAFIFVPLALLESQTAATVWRVLNLASLVVIVALTIRRIRANALPSASHAELLVVAAIILGNLFAPKVVWQGQSSLLVLALVMSMWELTPQHWLAAGVCLAMAALKPQAAVLFGLWLLFERNWRVLATAAGATLVMSAYPFLTQGVELSVRSWLTVLQGYGAEGPNAPGFARLVTLQSFLYVVGIQVPNLTLVAVILTLVLWLLRNRISRDAVPGILLALSVTFISGHDQDLPWLIPLATTLWLRARCNRYRAVILGSILVLVMIPLRLLRAFDLEPLYPWRTVLVLLLVGLVVRWTWRHPMASDENVRPAIAPA